MVLNAVEKDILVNFLKARRGTQEETDAIDDIIELVAAQKGIDFEDEEWGHEYGTEGEDYGSGF